MMHAKSGVPRTRVRLAVEVAGSVAATLIVSALLAVVPKPWTTSHAPVTDMTSGGKFAARVPAVATDGVSTAQRGLALPVMTHLADEAVFAVSVLPAVRDETVKPSGESRDGKPTRSRTPLGIRSELRRAAEEIPASVASRTVAVAAASDNPTAQAQDVVLPRIITAARTVLSMTAAAGGVVLSHSLPQ